MARIEITVTGGSEYSVRGRPDASRGPVVRPIREVASQITAALDSLRDTYTQYYANDRKILSTERLGLNEMVEKFIGLLGGLVFGECAASSLRGYAGSLFSVKGLRTQAEYTGDAANRSWKLRGLFRQSDVDTESICGYLNERIAESIRLYMEFLRTAAEDRVVTPEERTESLPYLVDILHRAVYLHHFILSCRSTY